MRIEEGGGGNILSIYRVFYVSRYFFIYKHTYVHMYLVCNNFKKRLGLLRTQSRLGQ